jgi:hypothetical protein
MSYELWVGACGCLKNVDRFYVTFYSVDLHRF